MTSLRGLVISLGAGGSLIAAALCALVVVGGILAVRGATGGTGREGVGDVVMPSPTDIPRVVASEVADAPARRAASRTRVRGGRPATTRARVAARRQAVATRPRRSAPRLRASPTAPTESSPSEPSPSKPSPSGPSRSAPPRSAPPPIVPAPDTSEAADEVAGTVQRVVAETRKTAEPVVEAAPEPVAPVVDQVVQTVDQVAGTVDRVLAPVTGLLP